MVFHSAEYPWSSYHANALDKKIELLTPHSCYLSLGETVYLRKDCYRALFGQNFPERSLKDIRNTTNKAWVLGIIDLNDKLKSKRAGGQHLCNEVGIENHWSIKTGDNINNCDAIDSKLEKQKSSVELCPQYVLLYSYLFYQPMHRV